MNENTRETVETKDWPFRELMLATYHLAVENGGKLDTLNGTVADHDDEIYGNERKDIAGLKPTLRKLVEKIRVWQAVGAVIAGFAGWLGADRIFGG